MSLENRCDLVQICIKLLTGKTFYVTMSLEETVYDLKCKIEDKEGFICDQTRLICWGRGMEDFKLLTDYGIKPNQEEVVHVVLRMGVGG